MADLAHPPRKPLPTRPAMFAPPSRQPSNATVSSSTLAATISRSSSARTATTMVGPPPPGYVARMRRQKATVWCDRAQAEDPREAHARRVAKQRALLEVQARGPTGGHSTGGGRSSTLASTGKIRHSSASKPTAFTTGTMVGAAVPLRLSANEIGSAEDDTDLNSTSTPGDGLHRRTGSGRSSAGSARLSRPAPPPAGAPPPIPAPPLSPPFAPRRRCRPATPTRTTPSHHHHHHHSSPSLHSFPRPPMSSSSLSSVAGRDEPVLDYYYSYANPLHDVKMTTSSIGGGGGGGGTGVHGLEHHHSNAMVVEHGNAFRNFSRYQASDLGRI
ncbi:hypothetical protein LOY94_003608 [Ophidiomyces ophidiicola]|nr:hypothetical protein LOY94_003608 [Ophidiomyces ophidiicola]